MRRVDRYSSIAKMINSISLWPGTRGRTESLRRPIPRRGNQASCTHQASLLSSHAPWRFRISSCCHCCFRKNKSMRAMPGRKQEWIQRPPIRVLALQCPVPSLAVDTRIRSIYSDDSCDTTAISVPEVTQ